ncbi:DoxX family protein [Noviherbaspirillum aridicola]|uniref:GntR family transcriptional regulator n=1 Tax=Noviherbaspirillum aridicola TaxID=2849687 RepID=A0ABQ4Q0R5_9BURK|nr:DoxX family protein [Noviherbaspirillum aridicola]GIZ50631.1 GntR family transcriptional regulator [Noviherbaspirillum aridicola]
MNAYQSGGVSEDMGKLLLRATLAILILFHGVAKIFNGVGGIMGMVGKLGLPAEFGYLVYVGEVLAPLLVLIGIMTRPAALIIAVNMVFAVVLAHMGDLFSVTKTGGWALELQAMFLVAALAVALLGAGRYSAGGSGGRWN